jgi:hypothetical protein
MTKVPHRVAFFVWKAAIGEILTVDNLHRRHIMIMIGVVCVNIVGSQLIICFNVTEQPRCGGPCPCVSCGICSK